MNDWEKKPLLRTSEEGYRPVRLNILGDFVLSDADGRKLPIATKKNRALLAFLALSPGLQATRERLCGLLWGDRADDQARSSLRQSLAVLRKELGQIEELVLKTHDDIVALRSDTAQIDAVEFLALSNASEITPLREAAQLYRGELLNDTSIRDAAFEDWLSAERSRLRTTAIKIFDRLTPLEEGHSRIVAAQQLVSLDPLRESSHRLLMQAHADQGDNGLALKQFELCRKLLHEELSVEPARETLELRRQILEGNRKSITQNNVLAETPQTSQVEQLPSIAVLPFTNLSDNPSEDYFCDGITLSIISSLGRYHEFFVIDSNSSFAYRGKATKPFDAARELSVRYILEGSVQKSADHVRVSVQLVEGATGQQLWSQVYDRQIKNIFSVQDEITESIIGALGAGYGGRLRKAWRERKRPTGIETFVAMDYFQQAMDQWDFTKQGMIRARKLLHKAIESDPGFAKAYSKISWSYMVDAYCGLTDNYDTAMENARKFALEGLARDEGDSWARWAFAGYHMYKLNHGTALEEFRKAVDCNPSDAEVLTDYGQCLSYAGRAEEGIEQALKAIRLNPHHADWYTSQLGQLYFDARQYGKAISTFASPRWLDSAIMRVYQAASFAMLGRMDDAAAAVRRAIELDADASIEKWGSVKLAPYSDAGYLDHFRSALRKAGLPEVRRVNSLAQSVRPSIAVLPFANLSGDPQHDYFADGITEDITTELSRFKGLFVIARNSAFSFKAKSVTVATIANELGVRFLLEGSVRRSGDRVRVTARLVDAETGREAWSERYDRVIEDIFAVQDDVVRTIVATLEGQLASAVASQSRRQTPSNILAYECVLQARKFLDIYDSHSAEPLLRRAIAADPRYAQANAWMAMVYWVKFFQDHQDRDIAEAVAFGKTAVALDPGDSVCHMQLGFAYIFSRQLELADIHSLKALELNPADMLALGLRAQLLCRFGRSQEAIEALDQLVRHDPFPPNWYWENRSIVLLTLDKFEEALAAIQHLPELFWWNHGYVAVCCSRLGRIEEAQDAIKRALELCPELTIQRFMKGEPYKLLEDANRMIEGLRMAGLAEHAIASSSTRSGTKPSIAVLSFVNLSGDAKQDYLADGLAEDVIAGLSRFSSLVVISRNSSFRFRDGSADAKTVGHELGVQYLVAGSLRRKGGQIRITAQLIETASGAQLWTEKYERNVEDFMDLQDDMVHAIVTTFEHRIADIRASEISHQPTSNWAAYDYFLKARQLMSHYSNYAAAEEPLRRAIELDPSFSEAHARLAHVVMSKYWANGDRVHIEEASRHAKTAIRLNDRDSTAHTAMSLVSAFMNNYDLAFLHADRALELNPNNTQTAKNRAMWQVYVGKSAEALAAFDTILMRDPYPTPNSWEVKGAALFQLRRYDEAIKVFRMIPELQYWDRAYLVASYVGLGNKPEAKNELSALIAKHRDISISRVLQAENYADKDSREHLRHALLEAGLPE